MKYNNGLVIEGGGLRGVFASGVVDGLIKRGVRLDYVIGTSMGACNGANYVSGQFKRSYNTTVKYADDPRYMGMKNLFKTGSYFGMNFIFDELPYKLEKFDYQEFVGNDIEYKMVVTNCYTGKAEYYDKHEGSTLKLMQASTSLPFISKMVDYNGNKYLDGGIADSIPIRKAMCDGVDKIILVLTRDKDYRKEANNSYKLAKVWYPKYPALVEAIKERHINYNKTIDFIENIDKDRVLVIRPPKALDIKRIEKDKDKLDCVYNLGFEYVNTQYTKIMKFLSKE